MVKMEIDSFSKKYGCSNVEVISSFFITLHVTTNLWHKIGSHFFNDNISDKGLNDSVLAILKKIKQYYNHQIR